MDRNGLWHYEKINNNTTNKSKNIIKEDAKFNINNPNNWTFTKDQNDQNILPIKQEYLLYKKHNELAKQKDYEKMKRRNNYEKYLREQKIISPTPVKKKKN